MLRPTDEQLAPLGPMERVAFSIADGANRYPLLKRATQTYLSGFGMRWVHVSTRNLHHVEGQEKLRALAPDRGVMVVANHRSFFDLYVFSSMLFRSCGWVKNLYFPVRSDYFYERPTGVLVNALMSGLSMYPPVMRDPKKRGMNDYALDVLRELLAVPGNVVGMHPEGTRNKTPDPYTLLPAQPGSGQLAHAAKPIILPIFQLGLCNDILRQIGSNFDRTGDPITTVIGDPLDLSELYAEAPRLRTYKRISDKIAAAITALGARERALRKERGYPDLGQS